MWDRIRTGAVIDFLEVHIVHYHWPDFNIADSCIVIGGILLVLHSLVAAARTISPRLRANGSRHRKSRREGHLPAPQALY